MEYLIFGIVLLALILIAIGRGIYLDRKKQALFRESLRVDYGKLRKRDYSAERFLRMDRYFRKHAENGQIDDITWNDIGMDDVFISMNHTYSAIGEEYLYYMLRSAGHGLPELSGTEELIRYFREHEEKRIALQVNMAKLGYMGKFSLYDYLDHLDYLGERSNRMTYIRNALFFVFLFLMPFAFSVSLIGMLTILITNNLLYFKQKSDIEPYIISFVYVIRLLDSCERIEKIGFEDGPGTLQKVVSEMHEARLAMEPMRKGAFWVLFGNGSMGGNPAEMLIDYLKMAFHVDLICFNRMLAFLRTHSDQVDRICTSLGRMEACVAVGAYRKGLEDAHGYTVPRLWDTEEKTSVPVSLTMKEGYHPLLSDPIKNSIQAKTGVLITGSNASGKSTFLKTVALNAILAQTVHTCTAAAYEAPLFRIYSSMTLRDDLRGGDSYYIVEIKALKRILSAAAEAGRPILCFVDEVLRGTNTVERIAASTQILKSLPGERALCFAATHDIELTELLKASYQNYHFTEEMEDGGIVFPYRLLEGKATSRNAIKLLALLDYDQEIIQRAEALAEKFMREGTWT